MYAYTAAEVDYATKYVGIVEKLVQMLEVERIDSITTRVAHLIFGMEIRSRHEEELPSSNIEGLRVTNLQKKAWKLRNFAAELEMDADQIVTDIISHRKDVFGYLVKPKNELSDDWAEEMKLETYHEEILHTAVKYYSKIKMHSRQGPEMRDMAMQTIVN
jgi:hypothetical protein